MADKKVISIRFHNSSDEDMELYEKLENEALNGGSLASVAKARIAGGIGGRVLIKKIGKENMMKAADGCIKIKNFSIELAEKPVLYAKSITSQTANLLTQGV